MLVCAITGEIAQEPVITKSGNIFERRVIVTHLANTGTCPITNQPLSVEELIPVKTQQTVSKPRSTETTSLPGLMQTFQNEWDGLMLETFNLKKQLETSRQELSHALYQNDAACRVIARLTKERDMARRELEQLRQQIGRGGDAMDIDVGLDESVMNKLTKISQELSNERKSRVLPETLATSVSMQTYKCLSSYPPHQASSPGILCLDIHPVQQHITVTGGVDRNAIIFDRMLEKKIATLSGHTKEVTSVLFHPTRDIIITASNDTTARLWSTSQENNTDESKWRVVHTFNQHKGEITQCSLHASHDYFVTASKDHSWCFHDIEKRVTLLKVMEPDDSALTCTMLHPDGLILATGTADNVIRIWDLKSQKNVATFQGHRASITDLRFSENGYYLATAATDNLLKLWDLRGPSNINTLRLDTPVARLDFDYSGKYLAAAIEHEIRVFNVVGRNMEHLVTLDSHTEAVTDVKFGKDSLFLASTSMDRNLKFWGPPATTAAT